MKNACQYFGHDDLKSDLPSTPYKADSAKLSQPWPSLRPLPARVGSCSDVRDVSDEKMHETMDFSQPWPSCDVRTPGSQSCRITGSRLTSYLAPVSWGRKRPRDKPVSMLDSESHFPSSPTYSPIISTQGTVQFRAPLNSASSGKVAQEDWRKPTQAIVPRNKKSRTTNLQSSRKEKQGSGDIQAQLSRRPSNTISSLKLGVLQQTPKTTDAPGCIMYTSVSRSCTGPTRDIDVIGSEDVDFTHVQKGVGNNNLATPQGRTDCNPYTPAMINFQGWFYFYYCVYNVEHMPLHLK